MADSVALLSIDSISIISPDADDVRSKSDVILAFE